MGSEEIELCGMDGRFISRIDVVEEICSIDGLSCLCSDGSLLPFSIGSCFIV